MIEKGSELFSNIRKEIERQLRNKQNLARERLRILDEYIRPALREASSQIEISGIMFGSEFIEYRNNTLIFKCIGSSVIISTVIGGEHRYTDNILACEVSKELIIEKIGRFLIEL